MINNRIEKIPILSFFSGGGFLDMGFEQSGFEVVFSNEIDEDFARFYKQGMTSWSEESREISFVGDIKQVSRQMVETQVDQKFGIIGGPPCQDFSIRGSKEGFEGFRGTQTYHFYEKIIDLHPDFFVMENVPGLVLLKKTKKAFNSILDLFREDYLISSSRLNALHYGVPQYRERLFIFGIKRCLVKRNDLHMLANSWFDWPSPLYPKAETKYKWGEPAGREGGTTILPPKELCVDDILIKNGECKDIANTEEYFNLMNLEKAKLIPEGDTYRPSFKRLHRNKYSPTVCYGNNEVHLHPFLNRRLSVREALRIQGVPDTYVLSTPNNLTKKFKMIGNGVPVPLAESVACSIKDFLMSLDSWDTTPNENGHLVKRKT